MAEAIPGASAPAPEPGLLYERLRGIAGALRQSEDELFAERSTGDRGENERNLRAIKARRAGLYEESRRIRSALRTIGRGPTGAASGDAPWWQPWKKRPDPAVTTTGTRTP